MTDGPFKNSRLSNKWKRYGEDLVNDATSQKERATQACHSMLGDVDMKVLTPLLKELQAYAQLSQMDLDPVSPVEAIFDSHQKSLLGDTLQKHLIANIRGQIAPEKALDDALISAAKDWIGVTKNRLDEECIRARDLGDMNTENYRKGIDRNRETFSAIDPAKLRDALVSGNKRAFGSAHQKKVGVDEGPDE